MTLTTNILLIILGILWITTGVLVIILKAVSAIETVAKNAEQVEENGTKEFGFNLTRMPASNIVFTATYKVNQYNVSFIDYDGTVLKTDTIDYDTELSSITPPTDLFRENHVFTGWDSVLPATMPDHDITITATYQPILYNIEFVDYNGVNLHTATYNYDDDITTIVAPNDPVRKGYTFIGWDSSIINLEPETELEPQSTLPELIKEDVQTIHDFDYSNYTLYNPGKYIEAGYYLELDAELNSTNNIVFAERRLPPTGTKGSKWVLVDENGIPLERSQEESINYSNYTLYNPGKYIESGYYLELDAQLKSTNNIILAERRLPPTGAKGSKWVLVDENGLPLEKVQKESINYCDFTLYNPGKHVAPGKYVEITDECQPTSFIVYADKKLPPTSKKGNKWCYITSEVISSLSEVK